MSLGGAISAANLTALANDGSSVALRWLDMIPLPDTPDSIGNNDAADKPYFLKVVEDPTNKMIRLIADPLNLISVMGPARSGKSTLMNLLAGCTVSELFATYPGMETFTKGIYVPTRILSLPQFSSLEGAEPIEASNPNIKVSFVDTEGQGAMGAAYDLNLFSAALTTSRVVIYNRTGGLLTEEILSQLGMMTQAAQRLRSAGGTTAANGDQITGPTFGHLFIVFNQFRLNAVDTTETLKDKLFKPEKETGSSAVNRNNIRKLLASVFESIQVFILPDKLKEEARDALSDGTKKFLLLDDFQPQYHQFFSVLRHRLAEAVKTPRELFPNQSLTGGAVADFMPLFTDAINKSEPLNVPTIFEASQNEAIAKAKLGFMTALSRVTEGYTGEEPKPTQMLARLFDNDVALLLAQIAVTLSYMPATVVKRVQGECGELAQPPKDALLAANLTRLKALMAAALLSSLDLLNQNIELKIGQSAGGPTPSFLVPRGRVDATIQEVLAASKGTLKSKGDAYDPASMPENWEQTLSTAAEAKKTDLVARVAQAWMAWAAQASQEGLDTLTASLVELGKQIKLGEPEAYNTAAVAVLDKSKRALETKLVSEYAGTDQQAIQAKFATSGESIVAMQEALRAKSRDAVFKQLMRLEDIIEVEYKEQLRRAVEPGVEPLDFTLVTTEKAAMDRLLQFCQTNNVSENMSAEVELELRNFISDQKSAFRGLYNQACQEFGQYLEGQLKHKTPFLLTNFQSELDQMDLNTPRVTIETACNAKSTQILSQFEALKSQWRIQPDGVVSKNILETARRNLAETLGLEVKAKLSKYDEVVSAYNKALLSTIVVPLVDKCTDNKYATEMDLDNDVKAAEASFYKKCHGEPAADAQAKWNVFKNTTYPALVETVKRFNAFTVPGLTENEAISKKIQLHIINKIWPACATIASRLNMSYINASTFTGKAEDRGLKKKDKEPEAGENDRVFRLTNTYIANPPQPDMYKVDRSTNLEFFEWTVEISDIMWGKPIITDIKPLKVNSTQYSPQPEKFQVQVGNVDTFTTTTTDTTSWGVSLGGKYSYSWGNKKTVGEKTFEASFGFKYDTSKTEARQSTYTTDTRATLILPANRSNVIHQMVFDQRTTLPYTAKVRVIPRLRFQNGFTNWGGGGSYKTNPNTGAIKDGFKDGQSRVFKDFDFRRVDEILEDAREDADPWFWQLATSSERDPGRVILNLLEMLANPLTTEVYVKGKWEGVTGKYAVTTVAPAVTNLTLLPQEL